MQCIGKFLDFRSRDANGFHDLKLVRMASRFSKYFAFLCLVHCRWWGVFCHYGRYTFCGFGLISFKIRAEELHLANDLVGGGLRHSKKNPENNEQTRTL